MKSKAIFLALLALSFGAQAVPVSVDQVRVAAVAWAQKGQMPLLGAKGRVTVDVVTPYETAAGKRFYAVQMRTGGTVFMSSDTEDEPVIAFTGDSLARLDERSPLRALLEADARRPRRGGAAAAKWNRLLSGAAAKPTGIAGVDDVRVAPLLQTQWGQGAAYDADKRAVPCFNFYTPSTYNVIYDYQDDRSPVTNAPENCVCGCVATAMAQLMRYWRYPQDEIAPFGNGACSQPVGDTVIRIIGDKKGDHILSFDNPTTQTNLTAVAGVYDWANMPDCPMSIWDGEFHGTPVTEEGCRAIGCLTYDCGVSVGMGYNVAELGGSGILSSQSSRIPHALTNTFTYGSALLCQAHGLTSSEQVRGNVIFSNLDAGSPVMLLITGDGGHAVVGDGYGFSTFEGEKLPYVHLNMGWSGQCDVWYNLPTINTSENPEEFEGFDTIAGAVYNVSAEGIGWILSGRVTGADGAAVVGAKVTVRTSSGVVLNEIVTGENGIYVLEIPGSDTYDIHAESADGLLIDDRWSTVAVSPSTGGNSWGNDLVIRPPVARIAGRGEYSSLDRALEASETSDVVEILRSARLDRTMILTNDVTLVSTNDDPFASMILRTAGASLSVTNGVVFFTNVVFATEGSTPVSVQGEGKVRVAGIAVFDDIATCTPGIATACPTNLLLGGTLLSGITLDCATAREEGDLFGFCDAALSDEARGSACRIVPAHDTGLIGAMKDGADGLVWVEAVNVDPAVAVAYVNGEKKIYYRTLDCLLEKVAGDADIVVMRSGSKLQARHELPGDWSLAPEVGASVPMSFAVLGDAGFSVGEGRSLTVAGLSLSGGRGNGLFFVNGGALSVSNSVIRDAEGTNMWSGAVAVKKGRAVLSGVEIRGCRASGKYSFSRSVDSCGGGVYAGYGADVTMSDCTVVGCSATKCGGGVYVIDGFRSWSDHAGASLHLGGAMTVLDNVSGTDASSMLSDDIYVGGTNRTSFTVLSPLKEFGAVGVKYGTSGGFGTRAGDAFATLDLGVEGAAKFAGVFFSDADGTLEAVFNEESDAFVWRVASTRKGSEEDGPGMVVVVSNRMTRSVLYYENVADAFAEISDAVCVFLRDDVMFDDTLAVTNDVVLTSDPNCGRRCAVVREGDLLDTCSIKVLAGGSLVVTNVSVYGCALDAGGETDTMIYSSPLILADGGALTLANGAEVAYAFGAASRAANAITAWNNGTVTMESGSIIRDSVNFHAESQVECGWGGGLLADKATLFLRGGEIACCVAENGGGAFVGNGSTAYVSGDFTAIENTDGTGLRSNMAVSDDSTLVLSDALTGTVGYIEGVNCDTNVFGVVAGDFPGDQDAKIASAGHFIHDRRFATGTVRQDPAIPETLLLVWSDDAPVVVPWPKAVEGLVYTGNELTGVVESAGFTLTGNVATDVGTYTATATLEEGCVWPNGSIDSYEVKWTISAKPTPPDPPPGPEPTPVPVEPIAFKSIERITDTEWRLVITNRVPYCSYRLLWTTDLTSGFVNEGDWETAAADANPEWVTNVITTGEAYFWKAEGRDGERPPEE